MPPSQASRSARRAASGASSSHGQRAARFVPRTTRISHVTSPAASSAASRKLATRPSVQVAAASLTSRGLLAPTR